ncbi:Alpha/Beta hydrolase protein [Mucor mucedo]|uniref:Alpha/Beta hydrolase protein n=1 Tax=Mucor mucedo TaxID=29922 RepID=UPI00221FD303|nr:Alpha/Beta hydrolase protein [Mucor mucedo]KAI7881504.1 Alpha/Beta hydrolase protein [Mucor mucedo]
MKIMETPEIKESLVTQYDKPIIYYAPPLIFNHVHIQPHPFFFSIFYFFFSFFFPFFFFFFFIKIMLKAVPLSFTKFGNQTKAPLIICHGLFGSKQNWKSLAKNINEQTQSPVYTVDARNHGNSPHVEPHTYGLMAQDILKLIKDEGLENPMLMGHSMGGKVMMDVALNQPELPSKLIVIDMPPIPIKLSTEYNTHAEAMKEINALQLKKQKEADEVLQKYEPDLIVRQFLLTNLKKNLKKDGIYEFRVAYDTLGRSIGHMGDFFQSEPNKVYHGPTLFITGDVSPYRKYFIQHADMIKAQFPNSRLENIKGAGHWVQTEQPKAFLSSVINFIN